MDEKFKNPCGRQEWGPGGSDTTRPAGWEPGGDSRGRQDGVLIVLDLQAARLLHVPQVTDLVVVILFGVTRAHLYPETRVTLTTTRQGLFVTNVCCLLWQWLRSHLKVRLPYFQITFPSKVCFAAAVRAIR